MVVSRNVRWLLLCATAANSPNTKFSLGFEIHSMDFKSQGEFHLSQSDYYILITANFEIPKIFPRGFRLLPIIGKKMVMMMMHVIRVYKQSVNTFITRAVDLLHFFV